MQTSLICERPVNKPDTILDLGPVDTTALQDRVLSLSDTVWTQENTRKENRYTVLRQTQHIIFRFIASNRDPRDFYANPIWPIWAPLLRPIMQHLVKPYAHHNVEFPKVMLARLPPGSKIKPHTDGQGSHPLTHKVHVPLATNLSALFTTNGVTRHLKAGHGYEVNNIARHSVENKGETDRIHLIFEHFDRAALPKLREP